jgi:hypothetical protein
MVGVQDEGTGSSAAAVVDVNLENEAPQVAVGEIVGVPEEIVHVLLEAHTVPLHCLHNSELAEIGTWALATPPPVTEAGTDG